MNEFQMVRQEIADLQSQLDKERARLEWCLKVGAAVLLDELLWDFYIDNLGCPRILIINGDINAAIDTASEGGSNEK